MPEAVPAPIAGERRSRPQSRVSRNASAAPARLLAGADVPTAALCYVWGRAQPAGSSGWNPYTDRVRMVVVDSGDTQAGQWRSHRRDLRSDWAEAFGGALPRISGLALSADTDNTGEQVEAWFADPRFEAAEPYVPADGEETDFGMLFLAQGLAKFPTFGVKCGNRRAGHRRCSR